MKLIAIISAILLLESTISAGLPSNEELADLIVSIQNAAGPSWRVDFEAGDNAIWATSSDSFSGTQGGLNPSIIPTITSPSLLIRLVDFIEPSQWSSIAKSRRARNDAADAKLVANVRRDRDHASPIMSGWLPRTMQEWHYFIEAAHASKELRGLPDHYRKGVAVCLDTSMLLTPEKKNDPAFLRTARSVEAVVALFMHYEGAQLLRLPQRD